MLLFGRGFSRVISNIIIPDGIPDDYFMLVYNHFSQCMNVFNTEQSEKKIFTLV